MVAGRDALAVSISLIVGGSRDGCVRIYIVEHDLMMRHMLDPHM